MIHVSVVTTIPTIKQVNANKNHKGKTLHLTMEVQNGLKKGLIDMNAYVNDGCRDCSKTWNYAFGVKQ